MEETDYIEKLKSLYPVEGEDVPHETLTLAGEAVSAFPQSAGLWCIRGDLMLLGSGEPGMGFAGALASYEQAIAVDPECVEAYEEIGYFYDLVMDHEERAKPFFEQATSLRDDRSA